MVKIIWASFLSSFLMQLVSNPKVNLTALQLFCNQGNHSETTKTTNCSVHITNTNF